MANEICFFEIPADDVAALQAFYSAMFDWTFSKMEGPFDYWMIGTGGSEPQGGMMARQHPHQGPVSYVMVDSVETSVQKAVELGASVIVPRSAVPGHGWFAVLTDPQNNPFGLWEYDTNAA